MKIKKIFLLTIVFALCPFNTTILAMEEKKNKLKNHTAKRAINTYKKASKELSETFQETKPRGGSVDAIVIHLLETSKMLKKENIAQYITPAVWEVARIANSIKGKKKHKKQYQQVTFSLGELALVQREIQKATNCPAEKEDQALIKKMFNPGLIKKMFNPEMHGLKKSLNKDLNALINISSEVINLLERSSPPHLKGRGFGASDLAHSLPGLKPKKFSTQNNEELKYLKKTTKKLKKQSEQNKKSSAFFNLENETSRIFYTNLIPVVGALCDIANIPENKNATAIELVGKAVAIRQKYQEKLDKRLHSIKISKGPVYF